MSHLIQCVACYEIHQQFLNESSIKGNPTPHFCHCGCNTHTHTHIMTDPPAGGAGQTVGHKNAWKLDAQSSLTVPIAQQSPYHFEYESAIVRSKSLWAVWEKTQATSPLVWKQNLLKCWYICKAYLYHQFCCPTDSKAKTSDGSAALRSAVRCSCNLTHWLLPCIVSPPSLSLLVLTATLPSRAFSVYDTDFYRKVSAVKCFGREWFT